MRKIKQNFPGLVLFTTPENVQQTALILGYNTDNAVITLLAYSDSGQTRLHKNVAFSQEPAAGCWSEPIDVQMSYGAETTKGAGG